MSEPGDFVREYFLQTRREIDTEKVERDHMLNFALLVLGAVGFATLQSKEAQEFLVSRRAVPLELGALGLLSTLVWLRVKKLQQIADRWYVLDRLVRREQPHLADDLLEGVVVPELPKARYIVKDCVLNLALAVPVYGALLINARWAFRQGHVGEATVVGLSIPLHALISSWVVWRRLESPFKDRKAKHTGAVVQGDGSGGVAHQGVAGADEAPLESRSAVEPRS